MRKLITMAVASAIMVTAMGIHAPSVEAKTLSLSSKKVTLSIGKSKTIKVRGAKKVKWKVVWGNKCIRLSNKKKTSVKIIAKKAGSAKIQAKAGKKKLSCRVTVSPKTTVLKMNVNKVDKATVKKVHETLSKGNTLRVRIQGGNRSQRVNTMDNLIDAVGKYNEYGVLPQISSTNGTKSYNEWKADKELAGQYKWGLLLVKDVVKEYKKDEIWQCGEEAALETGYNSMRDTFAEQYVEGSSDYLRVFKQVTGVTPEIYKECQMKKTSKVQYLYRFRETGHAGLCSNNPGITEIKDWYYATDKDGNPIEEGKIVTDNTITLGVEDFFDYEEKNEGNPNSISYGEYVGDINNYMLRIGAMWKIPYSDVVFHYEPFKADAMDKVNSEIQKEINEKVAKDKAEREAEINELKHNDPVFTKKFCTLSSAIQQSCIQEIMGGLGDFIIYDYKTLFGRMKGVMSATNKRSNGRIHAGGGAEGLRLAYQRKWTGVCSDYADLEMTIYDLFGLEATKISCYKCDHAWTVVKLTDSNGAVAYAKNDYGLGCVYNAMPDGCPRHDKSKYTGISSDVDFNYN